jgi:hypothetical protein
MALVKDQKYLVPWGTRNKKWYESKGYIFTAKGDLFLVSAEDLTRGSIQKIRYTCDSCNVEFDNVYSQYLINKNNNSGNDYCKVCAHKINNKYRHSYEYVKNYFTEQNCELLDTVYINNETKLHYRCSCGNTSWIRFSGFQNGERCKKCVKSRRKTRTLDFEYVKKFFEDNGCKLLSDTYVRNNKKLKYICECGSQSEISFNSFHFGSRCAKCSIRKTSAHRRNSFDKVKEIFETESCELLASEYLNSVTPIKFKCSCGNIDYVKLVNFVSGSRCKQCSQLKRSRAGNKNPNWNPNLSNEDRAIKRNYPEYKKWVKNVLHRDSYTCQCCGQIGYKLVAHHLDGYNWCVDKRIDMENGITLCNQCHKEFHCLYGNKDNTREQYYEYVNELFAQSKIS